MRIESLLIEFARRNIIVTLEDVALRYKGPQGAMTNALLEDLKASKPEFLSLFKKLPATVQYFFPQSHNQQSLWLLQQMQPDMGGYNIGFALRITDRLDINALRRAVMALIIRHPILRTTYGLVSDMSTLPIQHVHSMIEPAFTHTHGCPQDEEGLRTLIQERYSTPFDLLNGPVIRIDVFSLNETEHVLLMVLHHIACDGWASRALISDLGSFYMHETTGTGTPAESVGISYREFAQAQMIACDGATGKADFEYWKNKLTGAEFILDLRPDFLRPATETFRGDAVSFTIPESEYDALQKSAVQQSISPVALLLSAFQLQLMSESGTNEVLTGISTAGRFRKHWDATVGNFVNPTVIRSKADSAIPVADFTKAVHSAILEGLEHQDFPFSLFVNKFDPPRRAGAHPVFQVLFNVLPHQMLGPAMEFLYPYDLSVVKQWGGMRCKPLGLDQQTGNFDLSLEIADCGFRYYGVLKFRTDLFRRATVEEMVADYRAIIAQITSRPATTCSVFLLPICKVNKILFSSTFTAEPILPSVKFWNRLWKWSLESSVTAFNQLFRQLLDPASEFRNNRNGYNVLLVRFDDWIAGVAAEGKLDVLRKTTTQLIESLIAGIGGGGAIFIAVITKPAPSLLSDRLMHEALLESAVAIRTAFAGNRNATVITWEQIDDIYPVSGYYEPMGESLGNIPYTESYFTALGTMVARYIGSTTRPPFKAVVVDCDNTLWGGVLGEDGFDGIKVGEPFKRIQQFLLNLRSRGFLLCVCSKNNEQDVLAVFERHPDMLVRCEHLTAWRINWLPKSENIAAIARSLNIGTDSIVFIDDSPIECAEVRVHLPEVLSIQVPEEIDNGAFLLRHCWAFDQPLVTTEDRQRPDMYRQENQRKERRIQASSYADFIESLGLNIEIGPVTAGQIPRVSQLALRTNQFNSTTIRYSESQISEMIGRNNKQCIAVSVTDRFGDYGLVGVMVIDISGDRLTIRSMMLSCRVLGRGVEHRMLAFAGNLARSHGCAMVEVDFICTAKNEPIGSFLSGLHLQLEERSGAASYMLTAEAASDLVFRPDSETAESVLSAPGDQHPVAGDPAASFKADRYHRIVQKVMADLNSIEQIESCFRRPVREVNRIAGSNGSSGSSAKRENVSVAARLTEIWKDALSVESIGLDDNFFDAGGTSMQMPAVAMQIKKQIEVDISLVDLFQHTTIARLASFIGEKKSPGNSENGTDTAQQADRRKSMTDSLRKRQVAARGNN